MTTSVSSWRARRAVLDSLVRGRTLGPLLAVNSLAKGYYSVEFLVGGLRSGLLRHLADGARTLDELAAAHAVAPGMQSGLASWLDLGVTLGLLGVKDEHYRLRGLAKVVVRPEGDAVAAYCEEIASLHHRLIGETPQRLRDGRPFALGDADAALIARSSMTSRPYIAAALAEVVPASGPVRLLEVGCGSGVHIKTAADLNPQLTAVGLELQEPAAELARRNLEAWGLADRVRIEVGDVRERPEAPEADLVTLHQNIYYFPESERIELLRHLRGFLAPGGRLLVTTICRGDAHTSAALDLWGAMTAGAGRLPTADGLEAQLRRAGFAAVTGVPLLVGGLFSAFVADA